MEQGDIELILNRVNPRLLSSLDPQEKSEAIRDFRSLYAQEMSDVSLKVGRVERVRRRLRELERAEEEAKRVVKSSLVGRMEGHLRKREDYQLQKLKNYRRMEVQWKDKLKAIGSQAKEQRNKCLQMSDRLSKEALMFWQSREEKAKSSTPISKPTRIATRLDSPVSPTHFLTEADYDQPQRHFPKINSIERVKGAASRSLAVERQKANSIKEHLVRSNDFWRTKEESKLQKVMEKMQKIQQTRSRGKQKLILMSRLAKEDRKVGSTPVREERYRTLKTKIDRSDTSLRVFSLRDKRLQQTRESRNILFSNVEKRRIAKATSQFETRGQHFQEQSRKLRRQECRKMVQQAVCDLKLQALKSSR